MLMHQRSSPTSLELLELDLDARLVSLWLEAWSVAEWNEEAVAPFLRVAYWNGYTDALTESQRGVLYEDHGLDVPERGSCL